MRDKSIVFIAIMAVSFADDSARAHPLAPAHSEFFASTSSEFRFAPESLAIANLEMDFEADALWQAASPAAEEPSPAAPATASDLTTTDNRFFQRGSWRWQITGAGATEFDDHFALAGVAVSYFIERDFTIDFELNGMYFLQDEGDNTGGINLAMLLRWHFFIDDAERWSLYFDGGFGLLFTGDNVPAGGEKFSFTPQAGFGFSTLLDEASDARLLAGIRWHHTSNANLFEDNPGANKLMVYAGVNFPF